MPDEIVWVDKVLNPRSAVLTHSEAMTILKNAKTWLSQPRLKAPSHKTTTNSSEKAVPLAQQKEEYLQLQQTFIKQDEMKSILEMKAELEAIEKSKEVYQKAVEDGLLFSDGLPRLKPSLSLKRDIVKSKKVKMNQTGKKLAQVDKSAINANALENMFTNDDEDVDMIDLNAVENIQKETELLNAAIKPEEDQQIPWGEEDPKSFIHDDSDDAEDEEGNLKVPIEPPLETLDAVWRNYFTEKDDRSKAMENQIKPYTFLKSGKSNYSELIKDEKFCSKLLGSCNPDWDVSSYLGLTDHYRAKDNEFLPKLSTLNALYTAADLDLLQYQAEAAEINASRIRERHRVQHPIVKVPAKKIEDPSEAHLFSTKSISKCSTLRVRKPTTKKPAAGKPESKSSIPHNTIIHEAIQFLEKSPVSEKYQYEIKDAYKKLSKYPLTFLEKMNLIHTSPKDASGMLCQLDDLGLRFSKETLEEFERDCASLWPQKRERTKRNSTASGV